MSIILDKISHHFGTKKLFDDVTATFSPKRRYGLTGPNGAGKSTLLKIIMGLIQPTTGTVSLPKRVGILKQNIEDFRDCLVLHVAMMGNQRLWKALQERESLYEGEMTDAVGIRLGELEEVIAEEDGYSAESSAEELLVGAGVALTHHQRKMGEIPLDLQFRALLCQALFGEPEALLLDEPTNHLDLSSIRWLEGVLHGYQGTLIVVSHDRHFLNSVTTHIADIDYDTIIVYPGNYDEMVEMKTMARDRELADIKSKEKKISQLKEFVAKFGAGTRASQVQSRQREMAKLQPQEIKKSNIQRPYIRFPAPTVQPGQLIIKATDLCKSYQHPVISNLTLEIHRGDKIGVIGNNGLGKTTLMHLLTKHLNPDRGLVEYGHQVRLSYFPQNHSELIDKKDTKNAFEWLRARKAGLYDQDIRSVLGKLLFGGEDAFKSVATLSGGETARLILAGMMLEEHNVLILDEPTNHLDLEAVSALAWGLHEYPGTVMVVSHDRDLLEQCATKILAFTDKGIVFFDGPLQEYFQTLHE